MGSKAKFIHLKIEIILQIIFKIINLTDKVWNLNRIISMCDLYNIYAAKYNNKNFYSLAKYLFTDLTVYGIILIADRTCNFYHKFICNNIVCAMNLFLRICFMIIYDW